MHIFDRKNKKLHVKRTIEEIESKGEEGRNRLAIYTRDLRS